MQAQSSLDSTLVPGATTESTGATCSVDLGGSYHDTKFLNTNLKLFPNRYSSKKDAQGGESEEEQVRKGNGNATTAFMKYQSEADERFQKLELWKRIKLKWRRKEKG